MTGGGGHPTPQPTIVAPTPPPAATQDIEAFGTAIEIQSQIQQLEIDAIGTTGDEWMAIQNQIAQLRSYKMDYDEACRGWCRHRRFGEVFKTVMGHAVQRRPHRPCHYGGGDCRSMVSWTVCGPRSSRIQNHPPRTRRQFRQRNQVVRLDVAVARLPIRRLETEPANSAGLAMELLGLSREPVNRSLRLSSLPALWAAMLTPISE